MNLVETFSNYVRSFVNVEEENAASRPLYNIPESLHNGLQFILRFAQDPQTVGSVIPSSVYLAKSIVEHIPNQKTEDLSEKHYLEVGAGTGVFTKQIVQRLKSIDSLDVVEIDPTFCEILRKKYAAHPNVHVHCQPIETWTPTYEYDVIVSGLPLNSFSPEQVQTFLATFKQLVKHQGKISYFEYIGLARIKRSCLFGVKKQNFQRVLDIKKQFYHTHGIRKETVLINFPPARAVHFQIDKGL